MYHPVPPGEPACARARGARVLARAGHLRALDAAVRRPPQLGVLRGTADQRTACPAPITSRLARSRTCSRAPDDEGLLRPAQGRLGLPRAAGRARGRESVLGFSRVESAIEAYGVEEFNARCRESVLRHVDAWTYLTTRMAASGSTCPTVQHHGDLLTSTCGGRSRSDLRARVSWRRRTTSITPVLPALRHRAVRRRAGSPAVRPWSIRRCTCASPLTSGPYAGEASLLTWTTTPWTLVSNTAVAVHPDVTYVVATDGNETVVVAEPLFDEVLGDGWTEVARHAGRELERWQYRRPFELVDIPDAHIVVLGEYVTTDDGTGLVHQAPAFGDDDLKVCRAYGLPVVNPVRPDGTFDPDLELVGGQFFKKADEALVRDLEQRGLMFRHLEYEHAYPHCWRCHTPLLYAVPSWYIRTTAVKARGRGVPAEPISYSDPRCTPPGTGRSTRRTSRCDPRRSRSRPACVPHRVHEQVEARIGYAHRNACANTFAVVTPTRRPVNTPGPMPTAIGGHVIEREPISSQQYWIAGASGSAGAAGRCRRTSTRPRQHPLSTRARRRRGGSRCRSRAAASAARPGSASAGRSAARCRPAPAPSDHDSSSTRSVSAAPGSIRTTSARRHRPARPGRPTRRPYAAAVDELVEGRGRAVLRTVEPVHVDVGDAARGRRTPARS